MADFVAARRNMVECQIRTYDVTDLRLLAAMLDVPRERFVPADKQAIAYLDLDVPVTASSAARASRRLLKPMVLAKLIDAASFRDTDSVLDVGCATGYSSAVLAKLVQDVVALEEDAALAAVARQTLSQLGVRNVTVATGPLAAGHPASAPYDAVVLNGSVDFVPKALLDQVADGGRLVAVVGRGPMGKATIYRVASGHATAQPLFDAAAPPLPGFAKPVEFVF